MGGGSSIFTQQELSDYQELTYFTKKEIHHVFRRFESLAANNGKEVTKQTKLSHDDLFSLPELSVNPFQDRIVKVFSSSDDTKMSFEDFLDMMSVFSDNAPLSIKTEYAFRIYDFDEDDMIGRGDLHKVIDRLTGDQKLGESDMEQLIDSIMDEADLDNDDALSFAEFEHVATKNPEFMTSFRIRL
ncbi:calcium and integrin-binding protein 1-like [Ostrea edulis]|uniref:calcium and integrin-binding protein 1-like n=1 Tax=Ostrea edulis TaxID=37623 RepID=UPI002095F563|nr:calcium and integrin-binding protein 1-like [Ostrea edulis]